MGFPGETIRPTIFLGDAGDPGQIPPNYPLGSFLDPMSLLNTGQDELGGTEEVIIQAAEDLYQEWDDARANHLAESAVVWDRYLNRWDFSHKEEWQSQRKIPKVTMVVERLVAAMSRLISMSKRWFGVKARSPKKEKMVNFVRELMEFQLSHPKVQFLKFLRTSIKTGLLSHVMCSMSTWETHGIPNPEFDASSPAPQPRTPGMLGLGGVNLFGETFGTGQLQDGNEARVGIGGFTSFMRIENLNPHKVLLDPTGRQRGTIIERSYSKAEFRMEAEERVWDPAAVEAAIDSAFVDTEIADEDADRRDMPAQVARDQILIREHWVDHLPTKDGDLAVPARNFFFITANKKHLVQKPTPNPFWHGQNPVTSCMMIDVPFGVYGMSPIGISVECLELWVEFLNIVMDHYQEALLGIKEINMNNLHPDEEREGMLNLWPGKTFKKNSELPLINNVAVNPAPTDLGMFLSLLGAEIGEGTAMKDATEGNPRTRSRMSAAEYTTRMADAGVLLDSFMENVQDGFIVPNLRMAYLNTLQFMAQDDWVRFVEERQERYLDIAEDLEALKKMSPLERFELLGADIEFECKVFSAVFDRQQELEKGTFLLGMVSRAPMAQAHMKWGNYLKKQVENLGYDAEEMISDEPIVPYSELFGGKNAETGAPLGVGSGPSDGGEAIPTQSPGLGQMTGQASGILGSSGKIDSLFAKMTPGTPKPG